MPELLEADGLRPRAPRHLAEALDVSREAVAALDNLRRTGYAQALLEHLAGEHLLIRRGDRYFLRRHR